jgi:glutaredoxin
MRVLTSVLLTSVLLTLAASGASAQTDYRWIDPASGQTVFSDLPPPPGARHVRSRGQADADEAGGAADNASPLPLATRQAAGKFPVTLYSAASCTDPCVQARALLNARGVPFAEKMLQSAADAAELRERAGGSTEVFVPSLTVGTQFYRGFAADDWNNLLDLAGYPRSAPPGSRPAGVFAH